MDDLHILSVAWAGETDPITALGRQDRGTLTCSGVDGMSGTVRRATLLGGSRGSRAPPIMCHEIIINQFGNLGTKGYRGEN